MTGLLAMVLFAADPDLAAAEAAWAASEYELVLPRLEKALSHPLPSEELERAHALEAHAHAAFDRIDLATHAFRLLLGVNPGYLLEPDASPKLLATFAEARRQGPIVPGPEAMIPRARPPEPALIAPVAAPEVQPQGGVLKRWWFWTLVGVAVTGAAVGTTVAITQRPHVPAGTLGIGELR